MKRQRTASLLGVLVGLALLITACCTLPGCSTTPQYFALGFHYTTLPPEPRATQAPPHP